MHRRDQAATQSYLTNTDSMKHPQTSLRVPPAGFCGPGGAGVSSLGWSAAEPQDTHPHTAPPRRGGRTGSDGGQPFGITRVELFRAHDSDYDERRFWEWLLRAPRGGAIIFFRGPGVSLRSTPGYLRRPLRGHVRRLPSRPTAELSTIPQPSTKEKRSKKENHDDHREFATPTPQKPPYKQSASG